MALGKRPIEIVNEGIHQLLVKADHWQRIELKKVAKVQNGFAFSSDKFSKTDGKPLIRIRDIDQSKTVDNYVGTYNADFIVKRGDVLIGMDGDFKVAKWKGEDALLNQRVCRIVPYSDNFDEKFLFLCIQPFLNAIHSETSSVTVKHLSSKTIEEIPLPFPPLKEQLQIVQKIEELFSELDKGIENLKTAQQQLKVYRQAVLNLITNLEATRPIESILDNIDQGWSPKCHNESSKNNDEWAVIKTTAVQAGYFQDKENKILPENLTVKPQHELKEGDILITRAGPKVRVGVCCMIRKTRPKLLNCDKVYRLRVNNSTIIPEYLEVLLNSPVYSKQIEQMKTGISDSGVNLTQKGFLKILIPVPSIQEQKDIVQEIESRLSVCDKIEETITTSLQQAEALRQSILKKAFEGKLVKPKAIEIYKPKNEYFYQVQVLAAIAAASKQRGVNHGEMTIAKYAYLVDKIYQIPTYYNYKRWHLGPYPPEIKKAITNSKFFSKVNNSIEVKDIEALTKYSNPYTNKLNSAIDDLSDIFEGYNGKDRSHQIELLATVCKVIEDIQSTDLKAVRLSMVEWVIDLPTTQFKNKAQKFSEEDTKHCIELIKNKEWNNKLIKDE